MSFKVTYTYIKSADLTYKWPNIDSPWPAGLPWPTTNDELLQAGKILNKYSIKLQTVYSDDKLSVSNILEFPDTTSYGYFISDMYYTTQFNDIMLWIQNNKLILEVSISE